MSRLIVASALTGLLIHSASAQLPPDVKTSTFFGGTGTDRAIAVANGPDGRIYITGTTDIRDIPAAESFNFGPPGDVDIYVARLTLANNGVESVTYLGGTAEDAPYDIAIAPDGGIVVAGYSASPDFPTGNAFQSTLSGGGLNGYDGILFKLSADGSGIVYSTFIGGNDLDGNGVDGALGIEWARALLIEDDGTTWVTGETGAPDFPATQVFNGRSCLQDETVVGSPLIDDAWIAKVSSAGSLLLSTCIGGPQRDVGRDLNMTADGDIVLNGHTRSADFPVTAGVYQEERSGIGSAYDIFVMRLDSTLTTQVFSTYIGSTDTEFSQRSALSPSEGVILAGQTFSPDFPSTNATMFGGGDSDALILELSSDGTTLKHASFIGGPEAEYGFGLSLDFAGRVYMLGSIQPTVRQPGLDPEPGLPRTAMTRGGSGNGDAFAVTYGKTGPVSFNLLGGSNLDVGGVSIAFDANNHAWVSGDTESPDFPTLNAFQPSLNGIGDGFLARILLDADEDGITDDVDNCLKTQNDGQIDTNGDGYGNRCDPDLDNDGNVNFIDLQLFEAVFFAQEGDGVYDPDADFNSDGSINFIDLIVMEALFFSVPGPSALAP